MRVYYISGGYDGCYYARCLIPLVAGGWDGTKTSLLATAASNEEMTKGAMNADIIVFHRPMDQSRYESAKLLKLAGKKIVLDNDDTYIVAGGTLKPVLNLDAETMGKRVEQWETALKDFAEISDLVTVSTEPLAKEYREVNKNVKVLPNCVDPDDWDEPLRNETDTIRIGLVGSVVSDSDYEQIKPVIQDLLDSPKIKLVVFGLPPKRDDNKLAQEVFKESMDFWLSKDIEWQPFVQIADYASTLNELRLDLMLIPRTDDYFNRCKSNIKFLEAAMCEIPVIAQGFTTGDSPYQGKDEPYMRIAITREDWAREITELVNDKKKRREIGKKAREYVLENYDINKNIKLWEEAYESI